MKYLVPLACVAAVFASLPAARATDKIVVDPNSMQGRTQAAIEEFRAAVALEPDLGARDGTLQVLRGLPPGGRPRQRRRHGARHCRPARLGAGQAARGFPARPPLGFAHAGRGEAARSGGRAGPARRLGVCGELAASCAARGRYRRRREGSTRARSSTTATARPATAGSARASCEPCARGSLGSTTCTCCGSCTRRRKARGRAWTRRTGSGSARCPMRNARRSPTICLA